MKKEIIVSDSKDLRMKSLSSIIEKKWTKKGNRCFLLKEARELGGSADQEKEI